MSRQPALYLSDELPCEVIHLVLHGLCGEPGEYPALLPEIRVEVLNLNLLIPFHRALPGEREAAFHGLEGGFAVPGDDRVVHEEEFVPEDHGKDGLRDADHVGRKPCAVVLMGDERVEEILSRLPVVRRRWA